MRWALFLVLALPGGVSAGQLTESPQLLLRWSDPHRLFGSGWKPVGRELEKLFGEIGVELSWTRGDGEAVSTQREIRVVLVHSEASEWKLSSMAMGAVLSRRGPQSEIYIFFKSVVRTLGYSPKTLTERWPTAREKRELSRALGRVIAHEVIHAVLPELPHTDEGLMHFKLDRESLLAGDAHVDEKVAEAFREALATPIP